jgi:hypothetical protein
MKILPVQLLVFSLIVFACAVTFRILTSQELSVEGYGFKIYMEGSQK